MVRRQPQFDNTGKRTLGGMLRQDGHRTLMLDGEFFVRRRDRFDAPEAAHLDVPIEREIHPKDEPANFEKALRWQVMMICMAVGIPMNEVMGDEGVERWGRMISQRVQRQADLVHDMYEHQLLNRMRADFIDAVMAAGMWTPPADLKPWELYHCDWQWPVIPAARLDQELRALMEAVDKGHLPHSHVSRSLFGLKPEVVARTGARDQARLQTLGFQAGQAVWKTDTEMAARIQAMVDAEETAERDLVDEALLEDSVLDA